MRQKLHGAEALDGYAAFEVSASEREGTGAQLVLRTISRNRVAGFSCRKPSHATERQLTPVHSISRQHIPATSQLMQQNANSHQLMRVHSISCKHMPALDLTKDRTAAERHCMLEASSGTCMVCTELTGNSSDLSGACRCQVKQLMPAQAKSQANPSRVMPVHAASQLMPQNVNSRQLMPVHSISCTKAIGVDPPTN